MSVAIQLLSRQANEGFSDLDLVRLISKEAVDFKEAVWTFSDGSSVMWEIGVGFWDCSVLSQHDYADEKELDDFYEDCQSADDFMEVSDPANVVPHLKEPKPELKLSEILRKALHPNS